MKKNNFISRLRTWFNNLPIEDPINRKMGVLLQILLLGFIALQVIAVIANLFIGSSSMSRLETLIRGIIVIFIFSIPLFLLRRGYFRFVAILFIGLFLVLITYQIFATNLQSSSAILPFFTLVIILAGLLLSRRALIVTLLFSTGILLFVTFREQDPTLKREYIGIAFNFILINGLISIFINSFGAALQNALQSALQRESDAKNELKARQRIEGDLKNALEREQHLNEVTSTISSKLELDTILSIVVQLTAELVDANAGR